MQYRILACPYCGEDHPIPGINLHVLGKHRDRYPEFLGNYGEFKQAARVCEVPPALEDKPHPTGIPPSPREPGHVVPAGDDAPEATLLPVLAIASATSVHKSGDNVWKMVFWGLVLLFFIWLVYRISQGQRLAAAAGEHTVTPTGGLGQVSLACR